MTEWCHPMQAWTLLHWQLHLFWAIYLSSLGLSFPAY